MRILKNVSGLQLGAAFVAVGLLVAPAAFGQVVDEATPGLQFNFSTPGARSLAMGGAFIGLADDATAAYTNPAGLTTLRAPEIGLEFRSWDYTNDTFLEGGRWSGESTGDGIDTVDNPVYGNSTQDVSGVSFLSYVYAGSNWALALYGHQLANYEMSFRTDGAFFTSDEGDFRLFPIDNTVDLNIKNYGLSFAVNLSEKFSIGLGASYYDFALEGRTNRYDFATSTEPPNYDPTNIVNTQTTKGDNNDWGFNVGFLWRASEKFWLGGVYHSAPSFDFAYVGTCGANAPDCGVEFEQSGAFNVPTAYGLGIAIKPSDALTLTADWDRIEYSKLGEDLIFFPGFEDDLQNFSVADGDEYHFGLEYVFISMKSPLALRAGAWLDPAHAMIYSGDEQVFQAMFSGSSLIDDTWHYSAGVGMSFGGKFQIDLAGDFSDRTDTLSLSGVYRF